MFLNIPDALIDDELYIIGNELTNSVRFKSIKRWIKPLIGALGESEDVSRSFYIKLLQDGIAFLECAMRTKS